MPRCVLKKCCCCVKLRVGCFIIGYLMLVSYLLTIITELLAIYSKDKNDKNVGTLYSHLFLLVTSAIYMAFNIVLLIGLHKSKAGYILIYLYYQYFALVLSLISLIFFIATQSIGITSIVTLTIGLLCMVYVLIVIRSFYFEVLED